MKSATTTNRFLPYLLAIEPSASTQVRTTKLAGDASNREYFRLAYEGGRTSSIVVMKFDPTNIGKSEEATKASDSSDKFPFLDIANFLRQKAIPAPEIYLYDLSQGLIFLEDLGDIRLYDELQSSDDEKARALYLDAIRLLVDFQMATQSGANEDCILFQRSFDFELLFWELNHYLEWGIEALYDVKIPDAERKEIHKYFEIICHTLLKAPQRVAHRDFQSKNIMVRPEGLAIIDFQDALIAPDVYDIVALLRDSYVALNTDLIDELIGDYCRLMNERGETIEVEAFKERFRLQTLQRKLKDAGRFVFIDRVKKNPSFLQYIPNTLRYIQETFQALEDFQPLVSLLGKYEKRLLP